MTVINNDLNPILFRKDFSYARKAPTFVNNNTGASDEIARWVLDRNSILYRDQPHGPHFYIKVMNRLTGKKDLRNNPVLIMTDALIFKSDSIIRYYEQRCLHSDKLLPLDERKKKEVIDLYNLFTDEFQDKVNEYVFQLLLPNKKYALKLFKKGVPFKEKLLYTIGYPFIRKAITRDLNLAENTPYERLEVIKKTFKLVSGLLADGRKYLIGDTFTLADLSFAATAAPLILPVEYGGMISVINQVPDELREAITELRASPAGQYVFRMYQEERPMPRPQKELPKEPGLVGRAIGGLLISLMKKQSNLFYFIQKNFPVIKIGLAHLVTVNRNDLLVELLERDEDFTVEEINSAKMANQKGAFFLGMDRMNPQFDRERNFVRKATRKEDLDTIRHIVRTSTEEIIQNTHRFGKIDVASTLCYDTLIRVMDKYFGVPAPSIPRMKQWHRFLFFDLFLNLTNKESIHEKALKAALERRDWLLQIIAERKQDLKNGKTLDDNILNRLILMQQEEGNAWFDDDALQRNIGGLLTGIFETTNKAVILALDELFRQPQGMQGAKAAAHAMDMKKVYGYVSESLRFNPVQPGIIRFSEEKQVITGKGTKGYTIPAKSKVIALISAAMFDPAAFPDPKKFNGERETARYMNYGFGLHECYGKYINSVTIPEFVAAIVKLKNVRREPGRAGHGTGLHEMSFPNNFVVRFDTHVHGPVDA